MARALGSSAQLLLAWEAAYGDGGTAFVKLPFVSFDGGASQPLIADDILGLGRDPSTPLDDVIDVNISVVVPVDINNIGYWFHALFGGTNYTTFFDWDSAGTVPSFGLELGFTGSTDYFWFKGCRANSMSISMSRSGALTATIEIIGKSMTRAGTSQDASPQAQYDVSRVNQFQGKIIDNVTDVGSITGATLNFSNNLEPLPTLTADGTIEDVEEGQCSFGGSIQARLDDTVANDILAWAIAKTPKDIHFYWEIDGTHKLDIQAEATRFSTVPVSVSSGGGVDMSFDFQSYLPASTQMVEVELTNDQTAAADYDTIT